MITCSEWAEEILTRSHAAATRFNPEVVIRIASVDGTVQAVLAEDPSESDEPFALDGFEIFIEDGLEGMLDCTEPHDRLVLRPAGATPNTRGHA